MITTLLIDDEKSNSDILAEILKRYCPDVSVLGACTNIDEAVRFIATHNPQLIFLDVQMPNGSGFDLLDRIAGRQLEVIFVTAYDNFLLKAIRYSALDYVMKPVNIPEITNAVKRAEERLARKSVNKQLELLLANIQQPAHTQRIALPCKEGYIFVPVADIVRLEASGAYTVIHTRDGQSYLTSKNIREYEDLLPASVFCRVHHAHLVNLNFVKLYHKGRGGYLEMTNGASIEVSVRKKEEFLSRFK
jgi:two-component system LytT family response regulator